MRNRHRAFGFIGLFLLLQAFCPGCDEGADDPDEPPAEISGDSTLTIENPSQDKFAVYFDDVFIGRIQSGTSQTWSVPNGEHRVRVANLEHDQPGKYTGEWYFSPGSAVVLQIDLFESGKENGPTGLLPRRRLVRI